MITGKYILITDVEPYTADRGVPALLVKKRVE